MSSGQSINDGHALSSSAALMEYSRYSSSAFNISDDWFRKECNGTRSIAAAAAAPLTVEVVDT